MDRILVGLRLHRAQSTQNADDLVESLRTCLENLREIYARALEAGDVRFELTPAIAFDGADADLTAALQRLADGFQWPAVKNQSNDPDNANSVLKSAAKVHLIPVPIWLGFTPALNALCSFAYREKCRQV